ncbi:NAD(P)-binding domain-containing protein [Streptomyces sp. SID3343]|uniref:NAD(P)-dependent oxidoreductase n=1 Tax=Streptomyces sp. SID3343 TaxID=2690260 RepID=UPI0013696181|nr:NAD(P)-binding domain-containing protein [Streptomyces sp. SID3343]MYW00864.1 NAD(P)-binding domain-containing protein [Streptomyces sp. SID3343]
MNARNTPVTVLGLGAMGLAVADTFRRGGHATTVWNRTPGKADDLVTKGADLAASAADAVAASPVVVVVLLDHASVHRTLDPLADVLAGRVVVNLTTTTPEQARESAAWAAEHGITYLDGAIMAVPPMIGLPVASLLYSGSQAAYEAHRALLDLLGGAQYFGADAGRASLYDLALLGAMYSMFAGFAHGAAMVATEGVPAADFARMAGPWINAMTTSLPAQAEFFDKGEYAAETQSLNFNKLALDAIVETSRDQGVAVDVPAVVQTLIDRQVAAGHGTDSFNRIFESILRPASRA